MPKYWSIARLAACSAMVLLPLWAATTSASPGGTSDRSRRFRDRTTWDSVFSADQALRGETTYKALCARCHAETLSGGDAAGALTGSGFMSSWNGQTLADLHTRIHTTMPSDTPGVYGRAQVADVMAYMLRFNGFPAGERPLPPDEELLRSVRFVTGRP